MRWRLGGRGARCSWGPGLREGPSRELEPGRSCRKCSGLDAFHGRGEKYSGLPLRRRNSATTGRPRGKPARPLQPQAEPLETGGWGQQWRRGRRQPSWLWLTPSGLTRPCQGRDEGPPRSRLRCGGRGQEMDRPPAASRQTQPMP